MTSRRDFVVSSLLAGPSIAMARLNPGVNAPRPHEFATPADELDSQKFREGAVRGDVAAVAAYLDRDAALLYARDARDVSVFRLAVLAEQAKVVELLRSRGAVLDLFDAAAAGDEQRVTDLYREDQGVVRARTRFGTTALGCAAQAGQTPIVEFLMGRGADANANIADKNGRPLDLTPLRVALDYSKKAPAEKMAMWMLGNGADPNSPQEDGSTPLHAAARAGYDNAARMLLRKGADPAATDAEGRTALEVASLRADNPTVALLRSPGSATRDAYTSRFLANPGVTPANAQQTDGIPQDFINRFVTVCHFDPEQTRKLYMLCPSLIGTRSTWNEMGIEGAAHVGTYPCADFLLEKGAPLSICTATMMGMTARVVEMLREEPRRATERGAHDFPPLLYAAFGKEQVDAAELLLKSGADANANMRGVTALHFAARKGYVQLVELLLARGADPNLIADYAFLAQGTALAVAVKANREDVASVLRAHGARME
jgi:uncharacterized protein